jgi:dTDP-glucose pyrophosphorylase
MQTDDFLDKARGPGVDGAIVTFPSTHPKWSYVLVEGGQVVAAAEKRPISPDATVGLYYFRRVQHFVEAAENMLVKNASLHNEFYVCPVYNEYVLAGRRVITYPIDRQAMHSLGTPEDVERYAALLAHQSLQSTA